MAKEIDVVEWPEIVKKYVARNWFRRFKEVDISLEDKLRLGRPSVVDDAVFFELIEQ